METESRLPFSQPPNTDPYPETYEPNARSRTSFKINFSISFHLGLGPPSGVFLSGFPTKSAFNFLSLQCMLHVPPILFDLTLLDLFYGLNIW